MYDCEYATLMPASTLLRGIPSDISRFSSRNDTFRGNLSDLACSSAPIFIAPALNRLYEECVRMFRISYRVNAIAMETKDATALHIAVLLREICRRNRSDIDRLSLAFSNGSSPASLTASLDDDTAQVHAILDSIHNLVKDFWSRS